MIEESNIIETIVILRMFTVQDVSARKFKHVGWGSGIGIRTRILKYITIGNLSFFE